MGPKLAWCSSFLSGSSFFLIAVKAKHVLGDKPSFICDIPKEKWMMNNMVNTFYKSVQKLIKHKAILIFRVWNMMQNYVI